MAHPLRHGRDDPKSSDVHFVDLPREREEPTLTDIAPVPPSTASQPGPRNHYALAVLTGNHTGAIVPLGVHDIVVGRSAEADLQIDEPTLSRHHARVFRRDGSAGIEDLRSTNGTYVDGRAIHEPARLIDGNRIALGRHVLLRFFVQDKVEARATLQLYESSVRDPLTDTYNRRYLDERMAAEYSYAERHGVALAVLMVDIDQFKKVNDRFGHQVGDSVLKVARYGGEEFVIIARGVGARGALILAERVRRRIEQLPMPPGGPQSISVSVGVAVMTREHAYANPSELLDASDRAMYAAKAAGRNRVVLGEGRAILRRHVSRAQ
jgi:two-component system cell cycle response regulator